MHSAEWLRGAIHVAKDCEEPVAVAYYTKLLAAAEAREAGEPGLAEQLSEARARIDALEDSMNPQDVATVDATLREKAEQLAAAQAEARGLRLLADLWKNNAQKYREWVGRALDKQKEYLDLAQYFSGEDPARDARMKALGAAEWLEAAAREGGYYERSSEGMREEAAQLRQQAEAARAAEGQ